MSVMNFSEAVEFVLRNEMERREDLIILRPGARRALDESEREIALPRMGAASFSLATGAALLGMHPALDLRQEEDPLSLLIDALADMSSNLAPSMTIIVDVSDADELLDFPNLRAFHPQNPRQAVGLLRSALRSDGLSLFVAGIELSDMIDDVPDDPDFTLLPLDDTYEQPENEASASSEQSALEENDENSEIDETALDRVAFSKSTEKSESTPCESDVSSPFVAPVRVESEQSRFPALPVVCSMRRLSCDLSALNALAERLDAPQGLLERRCIERLPMQDLFCWEQDASALAGECAFLPPTDVAAYLWLGRDALSVTYDAARISHADAASLLRAARRLLENPELLIFDKEHDSL